MPYTVVRQGSQWLTINTATHQVKGKHTTREKAIRQRRMLESIRRRKGRK